jgi:uncharacterized protein YjiS (DUF1127 family)
MRDYALSRAEAAGVSAGTPQLLRLWNNWRARRALARMTHFDDYLLRDIGVAREDVIWAAGLPLCVNAALALEERSFARRRPLSRRI